MQVIYRLTSPSGAVYIGQTKNLVSRLSTYRTLKCKQQRKLYNSLVKYGFDAHDLYIVHRFPYPVSQDVIDQFETDVIGKHKHMMQCEMLNLTAGGRGNGHRGPQPREVQRADVRGEKHRLAKLTADDVQAMRSVYIKGSRGLGIRQLAEHFGISQRLVYNIVNHKTWKHVEDAGFSNSSDLALALRKRLIVETEQRARQRYGPAKRLDRCEALKPSGERCTNRATCGDTCGSHSAKFRELMRTKKQREVGSRPRIQGRFI